MYQLKKPESNKTKKRVGRGPGSGHGKTCCRGQDGQLSRSGSKKRAWFEGGQMPLQRRVPKRGFHNINKKYYQIVNIQDLNRVNADEINPEILADNRVIKKSHRLVKVLGVGELNKSVKVTADAFSNSAKEIITKAGGEAILREKITKQSQVEG